MPDAHQGGPARALHVFRSALSNVYAAQGWFTWAAEQPHYRPVAEAFAAWDADAACLRAALEEAGIKGAWTA